MAKRLTSVLMYHPGNDNALSDIKSWIHKHGLQDYLQIHSQDEIFTYLYISDEKGKVMLDLCFEKNNGTVEGMGGPFDIYGLESGIC